MDEATARLLTSPEAVALLAALPPYDQSATLRLGADLRRAGVEPELVAAVLTQSRLRERARVKLGDLAAGMLFTPDGLEQCTRLSLAARHAHRFRAAGVHRVFDLGCGLGVDAMALSSLDIAVTAVEADPATAVLAAYNLRHFTQTRVLTARVEDVPLPDPADATPGAHVGAWLDPARRDPSDTDSSGRARRVFAAASLSPPWAVVAGIAQRIPATGAKFGPTFPIGAIPPGCQAQWTSLAGEVLECVLWWGPLVTTPGRTATIIRGDREVTVTEADVAGADRPAGTTPRPGSYLYDPDRGLLVSGLLGALVGSVDGVEVAPGAGYVIASRAVDVGYASRYRVIEVLPLRAKTVRAWMRARSVGRVTVKKRGLSRDPAAFAASLQLAGSGPAATVVLTRSARSPVCLVVERDSAAATGAPTTPPPSGLDPDASR